LANTKTFCIKREIVEELGVEPVVGRLFYSNVFEQKDIDKHSLELMFEITNGEDFADLEKIRNLQRSHSFVQLIDIQVLGQVQFYLFLLLV
jgi:nitrogenase molybdenum-iron protein alpha/beta subunit